MSEKHLSEPQSQPWPLLILLSRVHPDPKPSKLDSLPWRSAGGRVSPSFPTNWCLSVQHVGYPVPASQLKWRWGGGGGVGGGNTTESRTKNTEENMVNSTIQTLRPIIAGSVLWCVECSFSLAPSVLNSLCPWWMTLSSFCLLRSRIPGVCQQCHAYETNILATVVWNCVSTNVHVPRQKLHVHLYPFKS